MHRELTICKQMRITLQARPKYSEEDSYRFDVRGQPQGPKLYDQEATLNLFLFGDPLVENLNKSVAVDTGILINVHFFSLS